MNLKIMNFKIVVYRSEKVVEINTIFKVIDISFARVKNAHFECNVNEKNLIGWKSHEK